MEWTVARVTTNTTPAREAEGRHPQRKLCRAERGIIGKAGMGKEAFCGLVIFTVMSVRRSSSFLACASSTSHSSGDG